MDYKDKLHIISFES